MARFGIGPTRLGSEVEKGTSIVGGLWCGSWIWKRRGGKEWNKLRQELKYEQRISRWSSINQTIGIERKISWNITWKWNCCKSNGPSKKYKRVIKVKIRPIIGLKKEEKCEKKWNCTVRKRGRIGIIN